MKAQEQEEGCLRAAVAEMDRTIYQLHPYDILGEMSFRRLRDKFVRQLAELQTKREAQAMSIYNAGIVEPDEARRFNAQIKLLDHIKSKIKEALDKALGPEKQSRLHNGLRTLEGVGRFRAGVSVVFGNAPHVVLTVDLYLGEIEKVKVGEWQEKVADPDDAERVVHLLLLRAWQAATAIYYRADRLSDWMGDAEEKLSNGGTSNG